MVPYVLQRLPGRSIGGQDGSSGARRRESEPSVWANEIETRMDAGGGQAMLKKVPDLEIKSGASPLADVTKPIEPRMVVAGVALAVTSGGSLSRTV